MNLLTTPIPNDEAAKLISDRPAVTRDVFDKLLPEFQQRAFTVSGIECLSTLRRVRELTAGLPLGGDWDELKKGILDEISPWLITATDPDDRAKQTTDAVRRAELILRNNGWAAYATTQHRMIMENADVFPYCQYISSEDSRVRQTHAALNKKIFLTVHIFWQTHTPPWEHGCRCDKVPMMQEDVDEIREEEKDKPWESRSVVEGPALTEIENGRLVMPNGTGFMDIRTPRERTGKGYEFRPDVISLNYEQVLQTYSPAEAATFRKWAEGIEIEPGLSLSESLGGPKPSAAPLVSAVLAPGAPIRISPVSGAIDVQLSRAAARKQVLETLDMIDLVHDDGQLPRIPLTGKTIRRNNLGEYVSNRITLDAIGINIKSSGSHVMMTTAHEVGHFLDHRALGARPGFWASLNPGGSIGQIVQQLRNTPTHARILAESGRPEYYASPKEMWARAYAQYIAKSSGHPVMRAELDAMRADPWAPWRQWPDDEFEPISDSITQHFKSLKWNPTQNL